MSAILFGSISTLADTSELQRRAFNESFESHGLDWQWSQPDYIAMLDSNGGAQRIADYAASHGDDVDPDAVHATKSQIFQELLATAGLTARPGVVATIQEAKRHNVKLGFVTTTSPENISALLETLSPDIEAGTFDLIVDRDAVVSPKPDGAVYSHALQQLGEDSGSVIAIEDNVGGVASASAAGVKCIAFPNENTAEGDFGEAAEIVDSLDAGHIVGLVA
ncbi:HAD-IA family hydrolase [Candidatus Mycobacterium wuenschmannii]|uniref:HAD-IA family hydrolase n=1 Tax=Candidatus Mycobacterium wuenschmannii TaxID=3027808 RepID=A0ABY8W3L0_9MYCO|nr:HAD-IA family hydrolase [Candidatus Mycobacterium wuenschmannii]WIM89003.1 HAD-IA family hydrolase [Candidatus Mycobacterium wuenschmannii]